MKKNSFHKTERLKSRKSIESLFKEGSVHKAYPFIVLFREVKDIKFPALMTVAVPKKKIRNATDRNLIKRRAREVYRQQKSELYKSLEEQSKMMELVFLYQSNQIEEYTSIERSIEKLMKKLSST
jgi:ribonuclease P protein component